MAFYISGPKLLFETTEISTHPNLTQQESNYIYLYTTKFGTSIKIRLNRKFESTEFETMRVNCISFFVCNLSSPNFDVEIIFKPILQTCILGVIIGKNGKNLDDIMNKSLAKIVKVDQADVSVVMLLAY